SECKYFECQVIDCDGHCNVDVTEESFVALVVLDGNGKICFEDSEMDFAKGECIFIPKRNAKMSISGKCSLMTVRI
ncbi:MAG: mannose-6-phosphate isomerase, partial [Lachnospiraceae bacterium]|nr:mannose-6-phosphate isomerase [Lachnospiraceae bacterium]